jgi:hypothetical protein
MRGVTLFDVMMLLALAARGKSMRRSCVAAIVICAAAANLAARAGEQVPRLTPPRVGALKNLIVELHSPATGDGKVITYRAHVTFSGSEKVGERDCWKLQFFPADKQPAEAQHRIAVSKDKESGWPRKVTPLQSNAEPILQHVGEAALILDAPVGMPVEILPTIRSTDFKEGASIARFQATRVNKETVLELTYIVDGREKLRIRQRWTEGNDWWRYYDKHIDGKLVLKARAFDAPVLADPFTKIEPEKPPPKFDIGLRLDKRLAVPVDFNLKSPTIAHMLERIQAATGLEIVLSKELEGHAPSMGSFQPGPKGFMAWQLMESLRLRQLENGRWEKTANGYQLLGESTFNPKKDAHPLRRDDRLRAMVQVDLGNPNLADLFERIKIASGVELELSPELSGHAPKLGYIGSGACYNLMELMATKDIENGRWDKTATGYRLQGVSKTPVAAPAPNATAVTPAPAPVTERAREHFYLWLCVGGGVTIVFFTILGAGIMLVRRSMSSRART